jgi:hypothetical protein
MNMRLGGPQAGINASEERKSLALTGNLSMFVCKCVLPPGDNPIALNKYII